jgi:hypothetical protein
MAGNKRRNPKTPSPKKKSNKKARATDSQEIHLPGGALQTSFRLGASNQYNYCMSVNWHTKQLHQLLQRVHHTC